MPFIGPKPADTVLDSTLIADGSITSAKIADGAIVNADLNNSAAIATSKITGLAASATTDTTNAANIASGTIADARISASSVQQHATSFDDNSIINDLSTLALREATRENLASYSTNSSFIDVFQDGSGVASNTNAPRNSGEYHATVSTTAESGGTDRSNDSFSWGYQSSNYTMNNRSVVHNPASYNYLSQMTNNYLSGNYKWKFQVDHSTMVNAPAPSSSSANRQFQYGVCIGTGVSFNQGNSIYGNNKSDMFFLAFDKATTSSSVLFYNGQSLQATVNSLNLTQSGFKFQFVRTLSPNSLKVYGGTGTDPYLTGTLLHTFTGHGSTSSNKVIYSTGYEGNNLGGITIASDIYYKENISNFGAETISATGSIIGNNITAPSSTNKVGGIITYQDNAGTNALNTDLILKLSADGGSNYSTATLTALPDLSTGVKMAKVNDLSVTAGTSIKYQLDFANQSSSKNARITGVSLQY